MQDSFELQMRIKEYFIFRPIRDIWEWNNNGKYTTLLSRLVHLRKLSIKDYNDFFEEVTIERLLAG